MPSWRRISFHYIKSRSTCLHRPALPAAAPPSRRPHPRRAALPTRAQNERPRRGSPRPEASERGAAGARPFLLRAVPPRGQLRSGPRRFAPARPAAGPGPPPHAAHPAAPRPPGSVLCCCRSPAAAHGRNGSARAQFRPPPPAARLARTPGRSGAERGDRGAATARGAAGNGTSRGCAAPPGPGLSGERPPQVLRAAGCGNHSRGPRRAARDAQPEEYGLEITNNGPITTGAQATIHATLRMKNNSAVSNLYHFNWIYAPLILIEKSEQRFNSMIHVAGEFPGTFPISVWVTHRNCWLCRPVARNVTMLQITEFVTGNLTIAQIEDSRFIKDGSSSSMGAVTRISFCLHDPSDYFKSASFVYNWDFGDGVYQITKEPFVYCNYSTTGNRTVHLKVVAEWEQTGSIMHETETVQKTGDFTTALELLDAVKSINVVGSRETHVMENLSLSLHINGTPPLALCWLIKSECIPLEGEKCHLVVITGSCYNLSHTFSDAGQYCLSVRVQNGVTMLQTYHEIKVWPAGIQPAFFVLLCIALVSVMVGLVLYTTFRSNTQQKDLVEVADFDFSPLSDKSLSSPSESGCGQVCCRSCFLRSSQEAARESHEFLLSFYKPVKMYTV